MPYIFIFINDLDIINSKGIDNNNVNNEVDSNKSNNQMYEVMKEMKGILNEMKLRQNYFLIVICIFIILIFISNLIIIFYKWFIIIFVFISYSFLLFLLINKKDGLKYKIILY